MFTDAGLFGTKLRLDKVLSKELGYNGPIVTASTIAHTQPVFYASGWDEASILTVDGVGEWSTTTWGVGRDKHIELQSELRFPHSLGLLYSAFTYYLGFKADSGEYSHGIGSIRYPKVCR